VLRAIRHAHGCQTSSVSTSCGRSCSTWCRTPSNSHQRGGHIAVECHPHGTLASFAVRDTGIGIPSDKVEGVFEPFVQVGKELNREGTGLGLSISRELARAMQGDLTAQSTLGKGSAFTVSLPRVVPQPAP